MLQDISGAWQEQVLYSFAGQPDLDLPSANILLDAQGNLYGCAQGGTHGQGGVFRLTPPGHGGGTWQETVLYNFGDHRDDPIATGQNYNGQQAFGCGITMDQTSNLIVGTSYGGGTYGTGTVFTLAPRAHPQADWLETVSHSFRGPRITGINPIAAPLEINGVYYGGTSNGLGEIYAFTP